mgnify:FL=1
MDIDLKYDRWLDEKEAAIHLKVKPSTLRTRRYKLGHNSVEPWKKLHAWLYIIFTQLNEFFCKNG